MVTQRKQARNDGEDRDIRKGPKYTPGGITVCISLEVLSRN
jgi:hypothetical protein